MPKVHKKISSIEEYILYRMAQEPNFCVIFSDIFTDKPIDKICDLLNLLNANGIKYAISSGKNAKDLCNMLEQNGLAEYFSYDNTFYALPEYNQASDELVMSYVHQNIINHSVINYYNVKQFIYAAAMLGFPSNKVVVVDSNSEGIISAIFANMEAIYLNQEKNDETDSTRHKIPNGYHYYAVNSAG